ncbi:MAG: (Fe-S)-binding protein [Sulfobacillus sp.]
MMAWNDILEEINHCNKCGFCLPTCPTYQITGNELASPRGRIAMVEALAREEITVGNGLDEALSYCLDCRACETACPSGVQYHKILEAGRQRLWSERPASRTYPWVVRQALNTVTRPKRLARMTWVARRLKKMPLPRTLKQFTPMLAHTAPLPSPLPDVPAPQHAVHFFEGCIMSAVFPEANQSARYLLQTCHVAVSSPQGQTCCGALHWHAGEIDTAKKLARQNIAAFEVGSDFIVNTAGGCGATLQEYKNLLADEPLWAERAERFSQRVKDWSTVFLAYGGTVSLEGQGEHVTLQNSCHLVNVEKAGDDAVAVLERVNNQAFTPLRSQNMCCGSAGTYNLEHTDWSLKILDQKMDEVDSMGPDRILVNNPGCHLQMQWGTTRRPSTAAVVVEHLATYLYRAAKTAYNSSKPLDSGKVD